MTFEKQVWIKCINTAIPLVVVAGVKVPQRKLREMMNTLHITECDQEKVVCYLLDDGGYIILSSEEDEDREVG